MDRIEGVEKLTLEAVAKKAISKGGLLYHFPNKEELIVGMVEQLSSIFVAEFNERAEHDIHCSSFYQSSNAKAASGRVCNIQNKIENDELNPVRSTIVRFVIDGLWLADMFGLASPNEEMRQKLWKN
nr:TetR/AcrR family transcriptional regulator [Paenibacillus farraposensis]